MITTIVTSYLRNRVKNVSFWGSARFTFDTEAQLLSVPKSFLRRFFATLNFILHVLYAVFVMAQSIRYKFFYEDNHELDEPSKVFLEMACLFHLVLPLSGHLCFFLREEAFANFVNQYLIFYRSVDGWRNSGKDGDAPKIETVCAQFLNFLTFMGNIIAPMWFTIGILQPEIPAYLSSVSDSPKSLSVLARVAYSLPSVYILRTWWCNMLFMATLIGYVFSVLAALQNFR